MLNQRLQNLRKHSASSFPSFNKKVVPYVAPLIVGASLPLFARLLDPLMLNSGVWETFLK